MNKPLAITLILIISILIFSNPAFAAKKLSNISDKIFAYTDTQNASPSNSFGANAGIIVGQEGVVVVDTLATAKEAQEMIHDIRKITNKPIRYVVNTHTHFDHCFGNSEFAKEGAIIISHKNGKANLIKWGDKLIGIVKNMGMTDELLEGTTISYPSVTFNDRIQIDLGNIIVDLIYIAPNHSTDNIMVYIQKEKVLFTGDILFTNFHAYIGNADLDGWKKNLDYIIKLDVDKIIPGHGPLSGKQDISDMRDYLIAFDKHARELCSSSDDLEAIVTQMEKALPRKAQGNWMIRSSIQQKYLKSNK
ncbi:MBL fold metallo-hydrolase [Desulfospira joergensenii]|uniref:MBL fold metallo-hydrolase n=1 Tax=Desulfospira joergensenii TaxID=53329 RepID=UPI0003B5C8C8|nr:MBL fold metallo-hydrolase [Desulfospira joergensenii]